MSGNKVTLKHLANQAGVSTTTVHRALHGKAGVGDDMTEKIKRLAAEAGYQPNYFAATLKGKAFKIAVALPEPTLNDRFYYMNLWLGVKCFLKDIPEFDLEIVEFYYPYGEGTNGKILKEIYEEHASNIDGLLTIAVDNAQSSYFLEKLKDAGVAIALVGSDLYKESRLCCVKTFDEMAGAMSANMLLSFSMQEEMKIIVTGSPFGPLAMLDQLNNLNGFLEYLADRPQKVEVIEIFEHPTDDVYTRMKETLSTTPDIYAIYSCSARHTVQACNAVEELGLSGKIKIIGNDCFPESLNSLKNGVLTATIDKKISDQTHLAMQSLFNFIVKGEYPPRSLICVAPSIVLRTNTDMDCSDPHTIISV